MNKTPLSKHLLTLILTFSHKIYRNRLRHRLRHRLRKKDLLNNIPAFFPQSFSATCFLQDLGII